MRCDNIQMEPQFMLECCFECMCVILNFFMSMSELTFYLFELKEGTLKAANKYLHDKVIARLYL